MADPSPARRVASGGDDEPFVRPAPPAAEVTISRELVRTLLAEQHPELADRDIAGPFEGFDMAVFRLGEDLAVRLPRHRDSVQSLAAEIRWIGQLGDRWTFPTQRIMHVGGPGAQSVRLATREPVLQRVLPELPAAGAPRGLVVDLDAAAALWCQAIAMPDDAPRVWIHADLHPINVIS
jgi:aminoglycoside phosphotransferase (APT) family kinase protein